MFWFYLSHDSIILSSTIFNTLCDALKLALRLLMPALSMFRSPWLMFPDDVAVLVDRSTMNDVCTHCKRERANMFGAIS